MAETVQRAYQYRFYPTALQRAKLNVYFGDARRRQSTRPVYSGIPGKSVTKE